MKIYWIIISIFLSYSLSLKANVSDDTTYIVIKIKGAIYHQEYARNLLPEDEFQCSDQLRFSSIEDLMVVIDKRKEESYLIRPEKDLENYQVLPSKILVNRRPGKLINYVNVVKYFQEMQPLLILEDRTSIEIGGGFLMDDQHYFYLQFDWDGDASEKINKKLTFQGQQLQLIKQEILQVDGRPVKWEDTHNHKLFYYDAIKESSLLISDIDLAFVASQMLQKEIAILVKQFGKKHRLISSKIEAYIQQVYGKPNPADLKAWLSEHFNISYQIR